MTRPVVAQDDPAAFGSVPVCSKAVVTDLRNCSFWAVPLVGAQKDFVRGLWGDGSLCASIRLRRTLRELRRRVRATLRTLGR